LDCGGSPLKRRVHAERGGKGPCSAAGLQRDSHNLEKRRNWGGPASRGGEGVAVMASGITRKKKGGRPPNPVGEAMTIGREHLDRYKKKKNRMVNLRAGSGVTGLCQ